jgi:hypothetical protein
VSDGGGLSRLCVAYVDGVRGRAEGGPVRVARGLGEEPGSQSFQGGGT